MPPRALIEPEIGRWLSFFSSSVPGMACQILSPAAPALPEWRPVRIQ
jgi:hypothetical protein